MSKKALLLAAGLMGCLIGNATGWEAAIQGLVIEDCNVHLCQPARDTSPVLNLKLNPLYLLDPLSPGPQVGAELFLAPRLSANLAAGPMFNARLYTEDPTAEDFFGYRLHGALRYYLKPIQPGGDFSTFLEGFYLNHYREAKIAGDFFRRTPAGSFQQRINYDMEQRLQGGFLCLGLQQVYASRFIFEFAAGAGVRHRREEYGGVPADAFLSTNGSSSWEYIAGGRDYASFGILFYLNLGYVLK